MIVVVVVVEFRGYSIFLWSTAGWVSANGSMGDGYVTRRVHPMVC